MSLPINYLYKLHFEDGARTLEQAETTWTDLYRMNIYIENLIRTYTTGHWEMEVISEEPYVEEEVWVEDDFIGDLTFQLNEQMTPIDLLEPFKASIIGVREDNTEVTIIYQGFYNSILDLVETWTNLRLSDNQYTKIYFTIPYQEQ